MKGLTTQYLLQIAKNDLWGCLEEAADRRWRLNASAEMARPVGGGANISMWRGLGLAVLLEYRGQRMCLSPFSPVRPLYFM